MKRQNQFDEVMIVNPNGSGTQSDQRVRLMRFHNMYTPEMGGFAEPDAYGYYGEPEPLDYYAQAEPYGYFAEDPMYAEIDPTVGYWGEVDPTVNYYGEVDPTVGYYGEVDPTVGYYGEVDPTVGYWGELDPTVGYYGATDPAYGYYGEVPAHMGYAYGSVAPTGYAAEDPVGYYAEENPVGYYSEETPLGDYGYSEVPEMVGYGEQEFAEDYPGVSYYGESDYSGYVREGEYPFNAGCPSPSNVSGFEDGFTGYAKPATVNPSCDQMTAQPGSAPLAPETFKPLW
jgi:hypothetical protein